MQTAFQIKGVTIGDGTPVICVPVVAAKKEDIIAQIRDYAASDQIHMIEWRIDCFDGADDPAQAEDILKEIQKDVSDTVLLFTFRTEKQGGKRSMPEDKIRRLNELAAKSGSVDLVDLEFFEATKPEKDIKRLQRLGVRVIASHHDFHATPDERILHMLLDQMRQGGADVAKLAVMPNNADDVLRLLKVTYDIHQKYPSLPLVTMSMGAVGVISRMAGELFGSCITFGAVGETSAPGQIPMDHLQSILDEIHAGLEKEDN